MEDVSPRSLNCSIRSRARETSEQGKGRVPGLLAEQEKHWPVLSVSQFQDT